MCQLLAVVGLLPIPLASVLTSRDKIQNQQADRLADKLLIVSKNYQLFYYQLHLKKNYFIYFIS